MDRCADGRISSAVDDQVAGACHGGTADGQHAAADVGPSLAAVKGDVRADGVCGAGAGIGNATGALTKVLQVTGANTYLGNIRTVNSTAGLNQLYFDPATGEIVYYQP